MTQSGSARDAVSAVFSSIGIVGLGLIGGSIARAVRDVWPSTTLIGVDTPQIVDLARAANVLDLGGSDLTILRPVDAVVLAAPVRQNRAVLASLANHLRPDTVVTDAGSTKRDIVSAAASLQPRLRFVGGHPLGGGAVRGFEHARADLFREKPWIFTPVDDGSGEALARLTAFAAALGAIPRVMDADAHDRLLAFVSHLPQLAASALMDVVGKAVGGEGLAMAGRGLADTTRLASSPAEIWRDIAAANADHLGAAIDELVAVLQALRADLAEGSELADVFANAGRWRDELSRRSTL